jgi:S-layer protein
MAMTAEQRTAIIKAVVGMFGAAPGATYLNELSPYAGKTTQLIHDLTTTTAFKTLYPTFLTNQEFATKFLNNLLGSAVTDADAKAWAINWMTSMLNTGASRGQVIAEALAALDAISSNDAVWGKAAQQFDNKVTVAEYYTVTMGATSTDLTTLQSVVANVTNTTDVSTPEKIEQIIDETPGGATGQTFTLTTGVDNIVGTSGNDTIIADNTGSANQLSAADQINGGAGTDTLKIYQASATGLDTTVFGVLSNVENVYINSGALSNSKTLDVSGLTGVKSIALDSPKAMGGSDTFTLKTAAGQAVSLTKVVGTTGGSAAFNLDGASDVTLNGVGTDLTLDLISTGAALNLTASGAASTITLKNAGGKLANLTIAGDKDLSITESLTTLTTIDAHAASGDITVDMSGAASDFNLTFTGGSGNDTLVFNAGQLTKNDVIDMGDGTADAIVINGTTLDYAGINAVKHAEILGLGKTDATVDISQITNGINEFAVGAGNLSETFNNALSTSKFMIDNSSGTKTITIANKTGEHDTSIAIDNQSGSSQTLTALALTGATNISLESTGEADGANVITTLGNADNSAITVTGDLDLKFTVAGTTTGSQVDAHAFTGKLDVTSSGQGDVLIGGSGDDTFTLMGKDEVTGNGGKDDFDVSGAVNSGQDVDVFIHDLVAGDTITFADQGTETWTKTKVDVSTATSLADAIGLVTGGDGSTNGIIKWFQYDNNTYVVEDMTNGGYAAATDIVVKIAGTVDLSHATLGGTTGNVLTMA